MMASQELGIPTLNGYSGWAPTDYPLLRTAQDVERAGSRRCRRCTAAAGCARVPGYAQGGFEGLVAAGRSRPVAEQPWTAAGPLPGKRPDLYEAFLKALILVAAAIRP